MSRNNKSISDETLLGYLLMALPDEELEQIELLTLTDKVLKQRIDDLRVLLDPVRHSKDEFEPRADLTASTMAAITNAETNRSALTLSQPHFEGTRSTRLAWMDSLVALAAGMIVLSVLLPSVWISRETSRRFTCTSNMREIGAAINTFAIGNRSQQLPSIEPVGPLSFAGVYAIRLKDAGLLPMSQWIWCPAIEEVDIDQSIPSMKTYLSASAGTQTNWRYTAGGNYSYNLGNLVDGEYHTPSLTGQQRFAIMGDTLESLEPDLESSAIHGRNSANILFDDGHIRFVRIDRLDSVRIDNPYLNRSMQRAAGIGLDDNCLGPSHQSPLILNANH